MELLRSLSQLLHSLRKRTVPDVLSKVPQKPGNKIWELSQLLQQDRFVDDEEAATYFYGCSPQKTAFQKLKSKTRRALVANLMRLDFYRMNLPERRRNYYEVHREYAVLQVLIGQRDRPTAVMLAKRTLKRTEKYEFTDLSVALLRFLRNHYGIQETEKETAEEYHQRLIHNQWVLAMEDELEYLYLRTVGKYSFTRVESIAGTFLDQKRISLKEIPRPEELPSYRSLLTGTLIRLTLLVEQNELSEAIQCLHKAIQLFKVKSYLADGPLQMLYPQLINLYIKVGIYDRAERAVFEALQYLNKQDFNWFKFQEQRFILLMHTEQYAAAESLYAEVVGNSNFVRMPNQVIEVWGLFEAYLAFLVQIGQLKDSANIRDFRSKRVQRGLKKFLKDKGGINLAFRIIDMLFALYDRQEEHLDNRADALNRYRLRYLNQPSAERADLVIRAINLMAREIIEKRSYERETSELIEQLQQYKAQIDEREYAFEIIPYEKLLKFISSKFS